MRAAPTEESLSGGLTLSVLIKCPKEGDSLAELGEIGRRRLWFREGEEEVNLEVRETWG